MRDGELGAAARKRVESAKHTLVECSECSGLRVRSGFVSAAVCRRACLAATAATIAEVTRCNCAAAVSCAALGFEQ